MRRVLAGLASAFVLLLLAAPSPAEARGRNGDRLYTTTYPSCGTYGCASRHERAVRLGSTRAPRAPSFRSYASRSRR